MTDGQRQRWQQLQAFRFDPPGTVIQFEDKLLMATGWTRHFAASAIEEYRRFLLLAATAGHKVSPPPIVDMVWHTHLLYTRNYWDDLCPNVLGFDLHHEPATGESTNREDLDVAYDRTLASYETIFGHTPPPNIWLAKPKDGLYHMVDVSRFICMRLPVWRAYLWGTWLMMFLLVIVTLGFLYFVRSR